MRYQILILDAIDVVTGWDLPEAAFGRAVVAQAEAMAGRHWD